MVSSVKQAIEEKVDMPIFAFFNEKSWEKDGVPHTFYTVNFVEIEEAAKEEIKCKFPIYA